MKFPSNNNNNNIRSVMDILLENLHTKLVVNTEHYKIK